MPRWAPDSSERLQAAALDLFAEQGFERTTVAEIASRAGLTPRTFFNHFSDKREALFGLSAPFEELVAGAIAASDAALPPFEVAVGALQAVADGIFEQRRDAVRRRRAVLEASPELHERDLSKQASLTETITTALSARGESEESREDGRRRRPAGVADRRAAVGTTGRAARAERAAVPRGAGAARDRGRPGRRPGPHDPRDVRSRGGPTAVTTRSSDGHEGGDPQGRSSRPTPSVVK